MPARRPRAVVVVTTLLDPAQATRGELAELYRARWHAELDLRSIKSAMQMGELRGKTPEMVRKEVWAHVLAYNLIRTVMAQAAARHDIPPRSISFTGAMQTLEAFEPLLALGPVRAAADRRDLCHEVLDAIATGFVDIQKEGLLHRVLVRTGLDKDAVFQEDVSGS